MQDILQEQILKESIKAVTFPGYTSENLDYLRKLRPSPTYDMIFTIVNPQPEKIKFEWNSQIFTERKNYFCYINLLVVFIKFYFSHFVAFL